LVFLSFRPWGDGRKGWGRGLAGWMKGRNAGEEEDREDLRERGV